MTKNDLKKYLLKNKPTASINYIRKGSAYYITIVEEKIITFQVPVDDMGDADFLPDMPAQLLIRWLL